MSSGSGSSRLVWSKDWMGKGRNAAKIIGMKRTGGTGEERERKGERVKEVYALACIVIT